MLDAAYPKGALNYWKSSFLTHLSDDAIETMIACFAECPTPMGQLLLEHVHGAAARIGISDTAFPHRSEGYNFLILCEWINEADNDRCIAWTRKTFAQMQPFFAPARYVNYLGDDELGEPMAAAYGPNYRRLQKLKAKYDPENFFRMNQNIRPLAVNRIGHACPHRHAHDEVPPNSTMRRLHGSMAEPRIRRRLAAIMAADVVGYSRLMGQNEAGTLAQLKECRTEVIHPSLARYDGRIVKVMGDGVLVEFSSAVDAVQSALDLQTAMAKRNDDVPAEIG